MTVFVFNISLGFFFRCNSQKTPWRYKTYMDTTMHYLCGRHFGYINICTYIFISLQSVQGKTKRNSSVNKKKSSRDEFKKKWKLKNKTKTTTKKTTDFSMNWSFFFGHPLRYIFVFKRWLIHFQGAWSPNWSTSMFPFFNASKVFLKVSGNLSVIRRVMSKIQSSQFAM